MSNKSPASLSFPANTSVDTAAAQAKHRATAAASITEQRAPSQVQKSSHQAALAGTSNGALPASK